MKSASVNFSKQKQKIRSGICRCGGYLPEHVSGFCLEKKREENRADKEVVDSLLGKTYFKMIERLGSFNFNTLLFKGLD
jgi:hypothetical protein